MFKIGEFSKIVRVSARMLRHYEENGLLKPAETDRFTGYRFYSMEQISELRHITELRDAGFGVEEIAATLPQLGDAGYMREALEKKRRKICENIAGEQKKLKKIAELNGRIADDIAEGNDMPETKEGTSTKTRRAKFVWIGPAMNIVMWAIAGTIALFSAVFGVGITVSMISIRPGDFIAAAVVGLGVMLFGLFLDFIFVSLCKFISNTFFYYGIVVDYKRRKKKGEKADADGDY